MAFTFTDENVKEIIASGKAVVVDFWATWCGPCCKMGPIVDELAEQYADRDDIVIGKYNIEDGGDFSTENRIMSIPAFLFFKNGVAQPSLRMAGSQTKAKLEANIEKLLAL